MAWMSWTSRSAVLRCAVLRCAVLCQLWLLWQELVAYGLDEQVGCAL